MTTYISPIFATGQEVDAALTRALSSVQEGDLRLTDSRNPLPHTHATAPSTQLEYTATPASGTLTLYPGNGTYQRADLPGDTTVVLVDPPAGEAGRLVLRYRVTGTSAAITWPANVRWLTTPVLATSGGTEGYVELEYGASGWVAKAYSPWQTDWDVIKALPQMVGYWNPSTTYTSTGSPVSVVPNACAISPPGPEFVVNGTFDADTTGWDSSNSAALSVESGKLKVLGTGVAYPRAGNSAPMVVGAGKLLKISLDFYKGTAAAVYVNLGYSAWGAQYLMASTTETEGRMTFLVQTVSPNLYLSLHGGSEVDKYCLFDNVSVVEISSSGTHATQYTTANKPILRQTPNTKQYWLEADSTDALNITLPAQLTNAAIFRVTAEGVTVDRTQTVATTYNLLKAYQYNGPIAIFDESSTALTTDQVAQITRFMRASAPSLGTPVPINGGFDDASGWTLNAGWSISGGVATYAGGASPATVYRSETTLSSLPVLFSADITVTASYMTPYGVMPARVVYASASIKDVGIRGASSNLGFMGGPNGAGTVDNFTVRGIL